MAGQLDRECSNPFFFFFFGHHFVSQPLLIKTPCKAPDQQDFFFFCDASLTVEAGVAYVLEQRLPLDGLHLRTDARVIGAQVPVHVVKSVGHGVHGVNHKLHLPFLLVLGVDPDALLA